MKMSSRIMTASLIASLLVTWLGAGVAAYAASPPLYSSVHAERHVVAAGGSRSGQSASGHARVMSRIVSGSRVHPAIPYVSPQDAARVRALFHHAAARQPAMPRHFALRAGGDHVAARRANPVVAPVWLIKAAVSAHRLHTDSFRRDAGPTCPAHGTWLPSAGGRLLPYLNEYYTGQADANGNCTTYFAPHTFDSNFTMAGDSSNNVQMAADLTISPGVTVTLPSGLTLQSSTGTLFVQGEFDMMGATLNAWGTKIEVQGGAKVNIQSSTLTNMGASDQPGIWQGIYFFPHSMGAINNSHISYAGMSGGTPGWCCYNTGIMVDGALPSIEGTTVDHSSGAGIWVHNDDNSTPTLAGDTLSNNATWPLYYEWVPTDLQNVTALQASGNGKGDMVTIAGSWHYGTGTWHNPGLPLHVLGTLNIDPASTFSIAGGTTIKFAPGAVLATRDSGTQGSTLTIGDTSGQPVLLTSDAASPKAGDWAGVYFNPHTAGTIQNTLISYAGYGAGTDEWCCYNTGIMIDSHSDKVTVKATTVDQSSGTGIDVTGGSAPALAHDILDLNASYPLWFDFVPTDLQNIHDLAVYGNNPDRVRLPGGSYTGTGSWHTVGSIVTTSGIATGIIPLDQTGTLNIDPAATLWILGGTTVEFGAGAVLATRDNGTQGATLKIGETWGKTVTLTSDASSPKAGDWAGVYFNPHTAGFIQNTLISYAGNGAGTDEWCCYNTGIMVDSHNVNVGVTNVTVDHSSGNGINVNSGSVVPLTNVSLTNNASYPLYYDTGTVPGDLSSLVTLGQVSRNGQGNAIGINGGHEALNGTWPNYGIPYRVEHDLWIDPATGCTTSSCTTLTIAPGDQLQYIGGNIHVGSKTTLVIGQGTTLKFAATGLIADPPTDGAPAGVIQAKGVSLHPITLTSVNDQVNGPVDATAQGHTAAAGDWQGVYLDKSASTLDNVKVLYAGMGGGIPVWCCYNTGIMIWDGADRITNSVVDHSSGAGIWVHNDDNSTPTLAGDTLSNNATWPLYYEWVPTDLQNVTALQASGNGKGDMVTIAGNGGGWHYGTGTWHNPGLPLHVLGTLNIDPASTFSIAGGTTIKFAPGAVLATRDSGTQGSTLTIGDTSGQPVLLTSDAASPKAGDWAGVYFNPHTAGTIQNTLISYAGYGAGTDEWCCYNTGIMIDSHNASVRVTNSLIQNSGGDDVAVTNGSQPALEHDTFASVPTTGTYYGVWADGQTPAPGADATYDYWMDASGPTISTNPGGKGTPVSTDVNYAPFTAAPGAPAFTATGAIASAIITFQSPTASSGGITGYVVKVVSPGGSPAGRVNGCVETASGCSVSVAAACPSASAPNCAITVTGLTNRVTYAITVAASGGSASTTSQPLYVIPQPGTALSYNGKLATPYTISNTFVMGQRLTLTPVPGSCTASVRNGTGSMSCNGQASGLTLTITTNTTTNTVSAALSGTDALPAGVYSLVLAYSGATPGPARESLTFTVSPASTVIRPAWTTNSSLVKAGTTARLSATAAGDRYHVPTLSILLTPRGVAGSTVPCGTSSAIGGVTTVTCSISTLPAGVYQVDYIAAGGYYQASYISVLTVYDGTAAAGGGSVTNSTSGSPANFGFIHKAGQPNQFLYVEHRLVGTTTVDIVVTGQPSTSGPAVTPSSSALFGIPCTISTFAETGMPGALLYRAGVYSCAVSAAAPSATATLGKFGLSVTNSARLSVKDLTFAPAAVGGTGRIVLR